MVICWVEGFCANSVAVTQSTTNAGPISRFDHIRCAPFRIRERFVELGSGVKIHFGGVLGSEVGVDAI